MTEISGKSVWVMAKGFAPDEGGHQTYAEQVALAYARKGARVSVFTQSSVGPRLATHQGLLLIDIGPGKGPWILSRWLSALQRERREGAEAPDFVHATTWRTAVPALLLGYQTCVTFHGREFMYARGLTQSILKWVARRGNPLVAVSQYSAQKLGEQLGPGAAQPIIAWNGVSIKPLPRRQKAHYPLMLLSLCRLEPRKNIIAAVQAAATLARKGYDFRYVICGRGPELDAVRALVDSLAMSHCIEVLGFVDHARALRLYAQADVFVHPQMTVDQGRDFEGFGIAIADAMFAGCAVILGIEGGASELIVHGESGLAVDGRNVEAIADAIGMLLKNHDMRTSLALRGQQRATELFQWDRHVALVLQEQR